MALIFLYGSLKKGKHANYMLGDTASFLGNATVKGNLYGTRGAAFPMAKFGEEGTIHGELWEVADKAVVRLDHYEGHPNFFQRKPVVARINPDQELNVESYEYVPDVRNQSPIEGGMW